MKIFFDNILIKKTDSRPFGRESVYQQDGKDFNLSGSRSCR